MDFVTHSLMGTGAARLICPKREALAPLSLAAVLGSLLQDGDSWLYLLGPNYYGKYHRVVSHCIWGLALVGLLSALIAWGVTAVRPWRRFGWFVSPNLARDLRPVRPHFLWFVLVAEVAACIHWCGDVITGFGNLEPFWPWSSWDASLHAVTSFDWFIFSTTLGWHLLIRQLEWPRHREAIVSAAYFAIIVLYALARLIWAEPTVW